MNKPLALGLGLGVVILMYIVLQQAYVVSPLVTHPMVALLSIAFIKIVGSLRNNTLPDEQRGAPREGAIPE